MSLNALLACCICTTAIQGMRMKKQTRTAAGSAAQELSNSVKQSQPVCIADKWKDCAYWNAQPTRCNANMKANCEFTCHEEVGCQQACVTSGSNRKCTFPFTYKGNTYNACTNKDHTTDWCATEVDSQGRFVSGKWDYCSAHCPQDSRNNVFEMYNPLQSQRFKQLQDHYSIPLTELLDGFECLRDGKPCVDEGSGAGISGATFMVSEDKRFVAKSLNDIDVGFLMNITGPYIDYMISNPKSLLSLMFTAVKQDFWKPCNNILQFGANGNCWIIMNNALSKKFHKRSVGGKYDIKGVDNRFSGLSKKDILLPPWSDPEGIEEQFPGIFLSPARKDSLLKQIEKDTQFLANQNTLDYSLLVQAEELGQCDDKALASICKGVEHAGGQQGLQCPTEHLSAGQPNADMELWMQDGLFRDHNGNVVGVRGNIIYSYSMGVIDFLASWSLAQIPGKLQEWLQRPDGELIEPWSYRKRFIEFFEAKIISEGLEEGQSVRDPTCECRDYHRRHVPGASNSLPCEVFAS